jgi:hypothetical protein
MSIAEDILFRIHENDSTRHNQGKRSSKNWLFLNVLPDQAPFLNAQSGSKFPLANSTRSAFLRMSAKAGP